MALDTANALITLAEFKQYIGQSTGSTSNDSRYEDIINQASWRFNSHTNRQLKSRSITEYRDGDGVNQIYTNQWPITSVSTNIDIRVDSDRNYTTDKKIDSSGIIIYSTVGKIKLENDSFECGDQSVKIVYTAGYTTIPHDISYACKEFCRLVWKRENSNHIGIKTESVEGGSVSYEMDMPWSVKKILDNYKSRDHFG